jgi:hypothetical protein
MDCHERLMARRRKKSSRTGATRQKHPNTILDKSLPSLPPEVIPETTLSPDYPTPPSDTYLETPAELPAATAPAAAATPPQYPRRTNGAKAANDERTGHVGEVDRKGVNSLLSAWGGCVRTKLTLGDRDLDIARHHVRPAQQQKLFDIGG